MNAPPSPPAPLAAVGLRPDLAGRGVGSSVASAGARSVQGRLVASATLLPMLLLALVVSFSVTPEDIETGRVVLSPTCHFKATFGRECPTCGLTRAFCALSHGRLGDAQRYNRAAPALYALWWAGSATALATLLHALLVRSEIRKVSP